METIRQQIIGLLGEGEFSALDISKLVRIREKDVFVHLEHIKRSIASQKRKLMVKPARCLGCGYVFESRNRFTKPGRCPRCRGEHIEDPKYRVL